MIQSCLRFILIVVLAAPLAAIADVQLPSSQSEITLSFAPLVKKSAPAVVNIYAQRVVEARASPFQNDPFFGNFFKDFGSTRPQVQNSLGSGVILSKDGIVVSNYHVVAGATDIQVVLNDGREFSAKPLLSDQQSDLAVLKIDTPAYLPFLNFRDSETVEVGELVLAIGNPFGVGQTVSSGIVSGLARSGAAQGNGRGYFIQTDAPINPGNSGGALVDISGRLIGINTSILTRSGGSNGIGFAIPASLVRQFVLQAKAGYSRFQRPWAGMSGQPLTPELARGLGVDLTVGMVITALHELSPFRAAGFKVGDVVVAVQGQAVSTTAEMLYRLSVAGIGANADVTRVNSEGRSDILVELATAPEYPPREIIEFDRRDFFPGLIISSINPAVQAELQLPWESKGFIVIDPGPLAVRVGLKAGDIIREANGRQVQTGYDINEFLRQNNRRGEILIQRGSRQIMLRFRL